MIWFVDTLIFKIWPFVEFYMCLMGLYTKKWPSLIWGILTPGIQWWFSLLKKPHKTLFFGYLCLTNNFGPLPASFYCPNYMVGGGQVQGERRRVRWSKEGHCHGRRYTNTHRACLAHWACTVNVHSYSYHDDTPLSTAVPSFFPLALTLLLPYS